MPDASLSDWFKRPLRTRVFLLEEGATLSSQFDPWADYINHPTIKSKVEGYRLWRGNLRVKFLITGSPYQYCPIIVSYKPLTAAGEDGQPLVDETFDFSGGTAPQYTSYQGDPAKLEMVHMSLRPHIMMYPHLSQGGEMCLPFVYPMEWQKFPYPGTTSSYPMLRPLNMGKITVRSLTPLLSCSGTVGQPVTITAFCWMENMELSVPTVGEFVEESMFGNTPAQVVSNVSNVVAESSWVPRFARTGARLVKGAADVAAMLGFTKHSVVGDSKQMRLAANMNMATTSVSTASEVLAIESGNSLSIDPSIMGPTQEDEMMVSNITARPCLTYKFTWDSGVAPNTIIAQGPVTPENYLITRHVGANGNSYNQLVMTNTAQIASLFRFWRGPITYTFQAVSTAFHKGRLYVTWEPDVNVDGFSTTLQRTEVFDIAESDRISFTVDYAKPEGWSHLDNNVIRGDTSNVTAWQSGAVTPNYKDGAYCNGKLVVRVMNELVSPITTAPVEVLVWVSGPGLEFAYPWVTGSTGYAGDLSNSSMTFLDPFTLQSYTKAVESKQGGAAVSLGAASHAADNQVYMGEQVLSLRSLCQRTNLLLEFQIAARANTDFPFWKEVNMPRFPYPLAIGLDRDGQFTNIPRYDLNGLDAARKSAGGTVTARCSFNRNLPYHFIAGSYTGLRGSVEYRITNSHSHINASSQNVSVTRYVRSNNPDATRLYTVNTPFSSEGTSMGIARSDTREGIVVSKLPMYSGYKFLSPNMSRDMVDNKDDWVGFNWSGVCTSGIGASQATVYFNTGDDFVAGWYLNPPTVYVSDVPYEGVNT